MTVQTVELKLQPLSAEAFRPYGEVLGPNQALCPETEEGRLSMELTHLWQDGPGRGPAPSGAVSPSIQRLANHPSSSQIFLPVKGSLVIVVAPPPRNLEADQADWDFDWDRLAAFVVEAGQAILVDKGTYHMVVALGQESMVANVNRSPRHAGERSRYILPFDVKRHNRIIRLVL